MVRFLLINIVNILYINTLLNILYFSGLDVLLPRGWSVQGPGLQVRPAVPGEVQETVHAAVASNSSEDSASSGHSDMESNKLL